MCREYKMCKGIGMKMMNVKDELNQFGLSPIDYENCVKVILDKKNGVVDVDWQEICSQYNLPISPDNLRRVSSTIFGGAFVAEYFSNKQQETNKEYDGKSCKEYSTTSLNKDGTLSSNKILQMTEEQSKDKNFLLKVHGFDCNEWDILSARNTIRQVISKQDGTVTLYASYITVKPKKDNDVSCEKYNEFFDRLDRNYSLPEIKENNYYKIGDKLLLIDIADLHMNLQASMFTTGNEYNCELAEKLFFYVIEDVLTRTKHYDFEEIVFCVGGDALNSDSISGTTTKGTPQTNDVHYYDAYEKLCEMTIKAIDILKNKCKVHVIYVMGNHDEVTGYKLAKYIDAWFRHEDRVVVDYRPLPRKYKVFGKTLLCFAHNGDIKKLPMLIADEAREYWSEVDTTEVFLQHLHTENVLFEDYNMRIQRLPTISGKSKWCNDKGFSSKRQCKSFIFDLENGLTDVIYTPILKSMM